MGTVADPLVTLNGLSQHPDQSHHRGDLNWSLPVDNILQHVTIGADDSNLKGIVIDVTMKTAILRSCDYRDFPTILKDVVGMCGTFDDTVIGEGQSGEVHRVVW